MQGSEIKSIGAMSVFLFMFGTCFTLALIFGFMVNLGLVPRVPPMLIRRIQMFLLKFAYMNPALRVLAGAAIVSFVAGFAGAIAALVYNVFAGLIGGVRAEFED
jgi:hypothetical protein